MNEIFKNFTEEVATKITESFLSPEIQSFIQKTKEAQDAGTFEVVISTEDIDRQGEVIKLSAWDFKNYELNPVVLWAHDYSSLPIGVCESVTKTDRELIAKGRFAPEEANPFAQQVRRLYDAKILRTTSVGLIARKIDGKTIVQAELLEFSFVPVPANPMALSVRQVKELGIDTQMLSLKGINLEVKEEEVKVEKKDAERIGAILTSMQAGIDDLIVRASQEILQTNSEIQNAAVPDSDRKGDAGEEKGESPAQNRSMDEGDKISSDFNSWKEDKEIIKSLSRTAVTALTEALTRMNKREKAK